MTDASDRGGMLAASAPTSQTLSWLAHHHAGVSKAVEQPGKDGRDGGAG